MNEKAIAIIALLENEAIGEKIKNAGSIEEVVEIFTENSIQVTADELKGIMVPLNDALSGDELDEAALEAVAGGVNWWKVGKLVVTIVGAICDFFK